MTITVDRPVTAAPQDENHPSWCYRRDLPPDLAAVDLGCHGAHTGITRAVQVSTSDNGDETVLVSANQIDGQAARVELVIETPDGYAYVNLTADQADEIAAQLVAAAYQARQA